MVSIPHSTYFVILLITLGLLSNQAAAAEGVTVIALRADSLAPGNSSITIGDIAELTGGPQSTRRRIAELDVGLLQSDVCRITKREVEFRCLLAGFLRSEFDVTGPDELQVRSLAPKQLQYVLEKLLAEEIGRQFGYEQEVTVRLLNLEQIKTLQEQLHSKNYQTTVLLPSQIPLGRNQIHVEFAIAQGERFSKSFDVQIIVTREVAVAVREIPKDTVLSPDAVRLIKRPVVSREDFADPGQLIGRRTSRAIKSNETILASHLIRKNSRTGVLVQRNALIDVVVRLGGNQIRLKNAKAMSAGNQGDTIKILNTRSNQRINAVIVNEHLATVTPVGKEIR